MRQYNSRQPRGPRKFWAFISYARGDEPSAAWLHRRLERYRIPKDLLVDPIEEGLRIDRLAPVFRDREELAASPDLGTSLKVALDASAFLILICSPSSARSQWVNAEASYFLERGRSNKIVYLVVDGEPLAGPRGFNPEIECLPPAIAAAVAAGHLAQPLWADVRRHQGGRRRAFAKVVASLIGAGVDIVFQREKRRTRRMIGSILAGAALTAAVFAVTIHLLNSAAQQRELTQQAEAQQRELAQQAEAQQRELAQKAAKTVEAARAEKTAGRMQSALGMLVTQAREMQQNSQPVPPDLRRLLLETLFVTPSIDARRVKLAVPPSASGSPGPELPDPITLALQYRHSQDGKLVGWRVDHSLQTAKPQRAAMTISAVNVDTGRFYSRDLPIDISNWSLSGEANLLVTCHNSNGTCVVRRLEDAANDIADTFSSADVFPHFLSIDAKLGQVYVAGTRTRTGRKEHVIVPRDYVGRRTGREITFASDDPLDTVKFFELFPEQDRMVAVTYERIYELKMSNGELMRTGLVRRGLLAEVRLQDRGIVVRMAYDIAMSRLAISSAARGTEVITFRGDGNRLEEAAAVTLGAAPGTAGAVPLSPQSVSGMVFLNGGRDLFVSGANPRLVSLPAGRDRKANEAGFSMGQGVMMAWRDPASGLLTALDRRWNLLTLRRRSALELARRKLDVASVHQIIPFGETDLAFYGEMRWLLLDRNSLELRMNEDLVMGSHHRVGRAFDPNTHRALMGSPYEETPLIELASDGRLKQRIKIERPHQFAMFKSASLTDDGSRVAVLWETSAAFERSQGRVRNPLEPYERGLFLSVYDAKDGRLIRGRPFEAPALALFPLKRGGFAVIVSKDGDHVMPGRVSYFSGDGEEKTSETIQPDDKLWLITTPIGDSVIVSDQSGRSAFAFDLEERRLKKLDLDSLKSTAGGFDCSLDLAAASPGRLLIAAIANRTAFRWSTCLLRSSANLTFEVLAVAPLVVSHGAAFAFLSERQFLSYDDSTGDFVTWGLPADDGELLAAAEDVLRQSAERARVN
jgi:cell division protein FtsB